MEELKTKHYLEYLKGTMHRRWNNLALADIDGVNRYNYSDLAREIERLHLTFELLGVKPGDKIALCGRNCANWAATFLAVVSYKAVVVSILPDFTGEGIEGLVNHSEAVLLYVGPNVRKKVEYELKPALREISSNESLFSSSLLSNRILASSNRKLLM